MAMQEQDMAECGTTSSERARRDDEKAASRFPWHRLLPFNPASARGHHADKRFPAIEVGWLSLATFHWFNDIIWRSYRGTLQLCDLWRLHPQNNAENAGAEVMREWERELEWHDGDATKASLQRCLLRTYRWRILQVFALMLVFSVLSFTGQALLVFELVSYAQRPAGDDDLRDGLLLVLGLFANEVVRTLTLSVHWYFGTDVGLRLRSAVNILVYGKILRLRGLGGMTIGQLVNLCVNDSERLYIAIQTCGFAIQGPLMIGAVLGYSVHLVGWPALLGFSTFVVFYCVMVAVSHYQAAFRRRAIKVTDVRVRTMNEILTFVKLIKMYAWERPFSAYVSDVRSLEKVQLRNSAYLQAIASSLVLVVPAVATVVTLAARTLTGGSLTIAEAFAVLSTFGAMRHPLGTLPYFVRAFSEARVALPRLKTVLLLPEKKPVSDGVSRDDLVVEMHEATLAWDSRDHAAANDHKTTPRQQQQKQQRTSKLRTGQRRWSTTAAQATQVAGHSKSSSMAYGKTSKKRRESERRLMSVSEPGNGAIDPADIPDCLANVTLDVKRGELIGVCGAFGSGKSSLLSALLGGMNLRSGTMAFKGSVAYVSQQAWIFNASLRENVLCGAPFHEERYLKALSCAALLPDLAILPDGDTTEIGERGINLSGGQKQRVSLARALYADRDVYLLDDPLSAVDAHVGAHIFSELVRKELKRKTVILVTHQLQYLPHCDRVVMMVGGRLAGSGRYATLMTNSTAFRSLIESFLHEKATESARKAAEQGDLKDGGCVAVSLENLYQSQLSLATSVIDNVSVGSDTDDTPPPSPPAAVLVQHESRKIGSVAWSTYLAFIRACGGAVPVLSLLLLSLVAAGMQTSTDYWLSYWLRQGDGSSGGGNASTTVNATVGITEPGIARATVAADTFTSTTVAATTAASTAAASGSISDNPDLQFYVGIYFALAATLIVFSIVRSVFAMTVLLHGVSRLHNRVFRKVFRAPMAFFESTPTGQIVNRFSKDMDELDAAMPFGAGIVVRNWFTILLSLVFASSVYPLLFPVLFLLVLAFVPIYRFFVLFCRDIKRLDGATRTPYISHLTATVQGLATVHAYSLDDEYRLRFAHLLDENTVCFQAFQLSVRWLAVRLDLLAAVMVAATALVLVAFRASVDVTLGAVALTYAVQLSAQLQFTVRMMSEVEARFTSVERLNHYATELAEEAPEHIADTEPPPEWPAQGRVVFDKVCMRYRDGTPQVLHELSFDVRPQEKIGVIGRTGAGKSSLAVCLLRLVELDSGRIFIDDVDISILGLNDLRSRLSIIPQDPVLFVGTIRYNLDPFNKHSDEEVDTALEQTHLQETIDRLPDGLETEVLENGENFSVGERQLMCMARALLRHSKILILDEATASIDSETDALIQKTIRECFADCTLLTIAHRLNTVLDSDRLLVLDAGRVAEFDTPARLTADRNSIVSKMLSAPVEQASKTQFRQRRRPVGVALRRPVSDVVNPIVGYESCV